MANENVVVKEESKQFVFDASRNGVTVPFFSDKTSRGKSVGVKFTYAEVNDNNIDLYIRGGNDGYGALGKEVLTGIVAAACRRAGQGWTTEACDDQTGFDKDEYLKFFSEWSARGQSIRELKEEAEKLQSEVFAKLETALLLKEPEKSAALVEIQKMGLKRKSLMEAIAKKKNKSKEEEAEAEAVLSQG